MIPKSPGNGEDVLAGWRISAKADIKEHLIATIPVATYEEKVSNINDNLPVLLYQHR